MKTKENPMNNPESPIHTMPDDGKHIDHPDCFCEPTLCYVNPETGCAQWLHNDTRKEALQ